MASKKITKEELRNPDFFLTHGHQFVDLLFKFKAPILAAGVVIFAAGAIWLGVDYWQTHQENLASTAIYPVEKKLHDEMEKSKTLSDANLNDFEKVLKTNSSSRSAVVSVITLTPDLIKAGKVGVAATWFRELTYSPSPKEVHFGLMKMTQGLVAMENHQPDEALSLYKQILDNDAQKSFHAEAMLKSGVAYEAKNDLVKARDMFERVHREHPRSQAGELAFQYLLYLDQKKGA